MIYEVFVIYDKKAQVYENPRLYRNSPEAIRAFTVAASDAGSDFHKYAEDYELYFVAHYDDITGRYESIERPELCITAVNASQTHVQHYAASMFNKDS